MRTYDITVPFVIFGVCSIAILVYLFISTRQQQLTDKQQYYLARACIEARGLPDIQPTGVGCREITWRTNRE